MIGGGILLALLVSILLIEAGIFIRVTILHGLSEFVFQSS